MIVAGTGHRPNKLGGYGQRAEWLVLSTATDWLRTNEPELVISGGALGWDQALARAAYSLDIPYEMYLPFKGFDCKWPWACRAELDKICDGAAGVKYICEEGYEPWKMQKRNEAMVDNCTDVLALWNGTPGGTGNCIKYAQSKNKPIINLWDKYEEWCAIKP